MKFFYTQLIFSLYFLLQYCITNGNNVSSVSKIYIDTTGLTITGFKYNPTHISSEWIDRIFLSKGVYFNHSNLILMKSSKLVTTEELNIAIDIIHEEFKLSPAEISPDCSIELLGYIILDITEPFMRTNRYTGPITGKSILFILNTEWICYYRAIFENWRPETDRTKPNNWPVLFYCPAPKKSLCDLILTDNISRNNQPMLMKMILPINYENRNKITSFKSNFEAKLNPLTRPIEWNNNNSHTKLAICTVIPYSSTDPEKRETNGVMLLEWIRYYHKLNMKIIIYDRDGSTSQYISQLSPSIASSLMYYNYTIRSLLDPASKGLKYDNNELNGAIFEDTLKQTKSRGSRFETQGKFSFKSYFLYSLSI